MRSLLAQCANEEERISALRDALLIDELMFTLCACVP